MPSKNRPAYDVNAEKFLKALLKYFHTNYDHLTVVPVLTRIDGTDMYNTYIILYRPPGLRTIRFGDKYGYDIATYKVPFPHEYFGLNIHITWDSMSIVEDVLCLTREKQLPFKQGINQILPNFSEVFVCNGNISYCNLSIGLGKPKKSIDTLFDNIRRYFNGSYNTDLMSYCFQSPAFLGAIRYLNQHLEVDKFTEGVWVEPYRNTNSLYGPSAYWQQEYRRFLTELSKHPDIWSKVKIPKSQLTNYAWGEGRAFSSHYDCVDAKPSKIIPLNYDKETWFAQSMKELTVATETRAEHLAACSDRD